MVTLADLEQLIEPVVSGLGCELWGIEFSIRSRIGQLRVFIDSAHGVGVTDCEQVSRQISSLLDVEDLIPGRYTLEVSSPGMDRRLFRLRQYDAFKGESIRLALKAPFEGRKNFKGVLMGTEGSDVVLRIDDEEMLVPFESIDKAYLIPDFPQSEKPVAQGTDANSGTQK